MNAKNSDYKYIGIFYFLTLGQMSDHTGIYDVTKITNNGANLNAFYTANNSTSPVGSAHFWDEPIWGYYNSEDPWVIRKQIEMFLYSGIDFLVMDCTNGITYDNVVEVLLNELLRYQKQGFDVPQLVYYFNRQSTTLVQNVYNKFYTQTKYKDLWFSPNGKPMIIANQGTGNTDVGDAVKYSILGPTITNYFDFKDRQWPTDSIGTIENAVPWIDFQYPQRIWQGNNNDNWINVSVAQHISPPISETHLNRGRGYTYTSTTKTDTFNDSKNDESKIAEGINFDYQWKNAFNKKSQYKYVFVTQWNEWVAAKAGPRSSGKYSMVDNFNIEYSRDIEPSKSLGDNYYYQLMTNIRKLNYSNEVDYVIPTKTIDVSSFNVNQWNSASIYKDLVEDNMDRYFLNMSKQGYYEDYSGVNDIAEVAVLVDNNNLYFRITCADNITSYSSNTKNWMNILIKTADGGSNIGYQYVINRMINTSTNESGIFKISGTSATAVGMGKVYVLDNVMQVSVPLTTLGLTPQNCRIEFKVADGVVNPLLDILNYYKYGDVAPIGRLSYVFG